MVVLTSNIGAETYASDGIGFGGRTPCADQEASSVLRAVRSRMAPELLNRAARGRASRRAPAGELSPGRRTVRDQVDAPWVIDTSLIFDHGVGPDCHHRCPARAWFGSLASGG